MNSVQLLKNRCARLGLLEILAGWGDIDKKQNKVNTLFSSSLISVSPRVKRRSKTQEGTSGLLRSGFMVESTQATSLTGRSKLPAGESHAWAGGLLSNYELTSLLVMYKSLGLWQILEPSASMTNLKSTRSNGQQWVDMRIKQSR